MIFKLLLPLLLLASSVLSIPTLPHGDRQVQNTDEKRTVTLGGSNKQHVPPAGFAHVEGSNVHLTLPPHAALATYEHPTFTEGDSKTGEYERREYQTQPPDDQLAEISAHAANRHRIAQHDNLYAANEQFNAAMLHDEDGNHEAALAAWKKGHEHRQASENHKGRAVIHEHYTNYGVPAGPEHDQQVQALIKWTKHSAKDATKSAKKARTGGRRAGRDSTNYY